MALLQQLDYQERALDAVQYHLENGVYRQCGISFTGSGKTKGISAHIPRRFEPFIRRQAGGHGGLLFIVHRREILKGAAQAFQDAYPEAWIGIEMGEEHCAGDEDFIFASVDSLGTLVGNRIIKMRHRLFGCIITDEGHHLTIDSKWDNVLNFFGVGSDRSQRVKLPNGEYPISLLLTATPNRTDGQPLTPFLDPIDGKNDFQPVFEYNLPWGIKNGWAVDIKAVHVEDQSGVTGKDHATEEEIDFLARVIQDHCADQQTLVFARSVEQSKLLAKALMTHGIARAGHVDGMTKADARKERVQQFADGVLSVMSNFGVFTEGTDIPGIQTVLMNRPVKSPVDFPQMVGRGTRPDPIVYTLKTPEERKAAIAASFKPYMTLLCTFAPEEWQSLDIVAKLTGLDSGIVPDSGQSIMDVVDVIEYMEEEMPEVDLHEFTSINDLKVGITEVNPWKQTVYNEKLKALSPLAWVQQDDSLSLWLPENPFSTVAYEQVPVILRFERQDAKTWTKRLIEVGGHNKVTGRVRKASSDDRGTTDNIQHAVQEVDRWLRGKAPSVYRAVQRGSHDLASAADRKYLKRVGVGTTDDLTQGTADVLKAHHRIKQSITKLDS